MEKKEYFRHTYAQEHWYKYDYAFTFIVTAISIVLFGAGGVFAMYAMVYQMLYLQIGIKNMFDIVAGIFVFLIGLFGVYAFFNNLYVYIYHAAEVNFKGDEIHAKSIFGLEWKIGLDEIGAVRGQEVKFAFTRFILESLDGTKKIYISPAIDDGGEMMERILDQAENCISVDLDYLLEDKKAWKKEPNWKLIEEAKERAAENRKNSAHV